MLSQNTKCQDFPGVQWLRLHPSTAGGRSLIPDQGARIPHAKQCGKKINKKLKCLKKDTQYKYKLRHTHCNMLKTLQKDIQLSQQQRAYITPRHWFLFTRPHQKEALRWMFNVFNTTSWRWTRDIMCLLVWCTEWTEYHLLLHTSQRQIRWRWVA